jgi:hypothetical protein
MWPASSYGSMQRDSHAHCKRPLCQQLPCATKQPPAAAAAAAAAVVLGLQSTCRTAGLHHSCSGVACSACSMLFYAPAAPQYVLLHSTTLHCACRNTQPEVHPQDSTGPSTYTAGLADDAIAVHYLQLLQGCTVRRIDSAHGYHSATQLLRTGHR